jgi:phospholipid-binding lipoprotein MlaA
MIAHRFSFLTPLLAVVLAGCATVPDGSVRDPNDPFEPTNRAMFDVALALDRAITKPVALGYRAVLPMEMRDMVRNFLNNLATVPVFANNVLQGKVERAGATLARGAVNTTIGIGGLFDVAQPLGLPLYYEDFGQTLAVWGVGEGPYLVMPLVGPTTARDLTGRVVDFFFDPFTYVEWRENYIPWGRVIVDNIDFRERTIQTLDDIEASSADFYSGVKGLYRQTRNNLITDGENEVEDLPDF